MGKSHLYITFVLSLLTTSCINDLNQKNPKSFKVEELTDYIGGNYTITNKSGDIYIQILDSEPIAKLRRTGSDYFSYQIVASLSSLMVYAAIPDREINKISVKIKDSSFVNLYNYPKELIDVVERKVYTIHNFSNAVIDKDWSIAKTYFSDTIQSLPDEKINQYFFDHYFNMGPILGFRVVGFKVLNNGDIAVGVDYYLEDGRRQTYIFLFYYHENDKIEHIHVPNYFLEYYS